MSSASVGLDTAIPRLRGALDAAASEGRRVLPRGGGTKDALSAPDDGTTALDLAAMSGIVEYAPSEFTVTALAGTPIAEIAATLDDRGQYLPFDPILIDAGTTLGGTIAAGVAGSGRVRYGGIRDFILGVRFLDGSGTLVRGGGKVVKNAAGFDLPKLMVGSLGGLGIVVEATLKVFPRAEATATGWIDHASLEGAVAAMQRLLRGPSEVDALDLEPPGRLWIRLAGRERALRPRLERALAIAAGSAPSAAPAQIVAADEAESHWHAMRELAWAPAGWALVKVPLQPGRIGAMEAALAGASGGAGGDVTSARPVARYTAGGQQALVAWPPGRALAEIDTALEGLGLSGLVVRGRCDRRRLGRRTAEAAIERVRRALDPQGRFRDP